MFRRYSWLRPRQLLSYSYGAVRLSFLTTFLSRGITRDEDKTTASLSDLLDIKSISYLVDTNNTHSSSFDHCTPTMPSYEFQHILPLTRAHKATLARAITDWHATTFNAPRFIVNCKFTDIRAQSPDDSWVGGLAMKTNRLDVFLRSGTGRTAQQYQDITTKVVSIWDEAVKDVQTAAESDKELKDVFIMGDIDSALERGFFLPMVGLIRLPAGLPAFSDPLANTHHPLRSRASSRSGSLRTSPSSKSWPIVATRPSRVC